MMGDQRFGPLVDTDWLAANATDAGIKILDGSFHLPTLGRDAKAEYQEAHIPGALFFDIDEIADQNTDLPHMLPTPEEFGTAVGAMGIGNDDTIVVYDVGTTTGAARVWWTFRVFGHARVAVLDGGLAKWRREGRPVTQDVAKPRPATYKAGFNAQLVRSRQQLLDNIGARTEQVVDARSAGRFEGREPEPRPGMRSGHIPGSRSLSFGQVLDASSNTLRSANDIRQAIENAGIAANAPIVTTCGSGVTASTLALAFHTVGLDNVAVYDGSWSEWGQPNADTPVATGPADNPH